jgi:hypothetical protein
VVVGLRCCRLEAIACMHQFLRQCGPLTDECNMHACIDPVHGALMSLDGWVPIGTLRSIGSR